MSPKRRMKVGQGPQQPEFVAVDQSDDEMDDREDDLQFGNVDAGQDTIAKQSISLSPRGTATHGPQLAAFETIVRGLVQGMQAVSNVSCAVLEHHINIHYPNARKALLTNSKALTSSMQDLIRTGYIQVATGVAPAGSAKLRYELTDKDGLPPAQEIVKILAWVETLPPQSASKQPAKSDGKWRKKALDAIVMRSMHDMLDWEGVHANVLKQALKGLDECHQVHRCLVLSMKNIDLVLADLVQRGLLERRGSSPLSRGRRASPSLRSVKLRCTSSVSLSQLEAAYAVFQLPVPDHAAAAARQAQLNDQAEHTATSLQPCAAESQPPQAQLSDRSAPQGDAQGDEVKEEHPKHASVGAAAENGAAVPAYALQMEGPNDVLDHQTTAAATAAAATAAAAATNSAANAESASEPHRMQNHVAALIAEQDPSAMQSGSDRLSAEQDPGQQAQAGAEGNNLDGLMLMVEEDRCKASFPQHNRGHKAKHGMLSQHLASQLFQGRSNVPEQHRQGTSVSGQGLVNTVAWEQSASDPVGVDDGDMPASAPPVGVTWLKKYAGAHGIDLQHGSWADSQGQGTLLQPPNEPEPSNMLPPALATRDPTSGRWVPHSMPINPFVIAQLSQEGAPCRAISHQPPPELQPAPSNQTSRKRTLDSTGAEPVKRQRIAGPSTASDPTAAHTHLGHPSHHPREAELASYPHMGSGQPSGATDWQGPGAVPFWAHGPESSHVPHTSWQLPQHAPSNNSAFVGGKAEPQCHRHQHSQQQPADGYTWQQPAPATGPSFHPNPVGRSPLHHELANFATLATPTEAEQQSVRDALDSVINITKIVWPESRTVLFGSQATNLALPGSDLDIVVLGVSENITHAASGFNRSQRELLGELLEDLLACLQTAGILKGSAKIIDARVPIIKCTLNFGAGLAADISLGAINGAAAVQNVCQMIATAPPLRVLVLVLKALLKETLLNEVFTGGLSSYSIVNMVMAHLLCMGYQLFNLPGPGGNGPGFWGSLVPPPGQAEQDLGVLLLSFLEHFGAEFDYAQHAVSVGQGGIVEKKREWKQVDRPWLLAVEDPQQLGKDIGSGTFNIRNVRHLFAAAAATLKEAQQTRTEQQQWSAVQADSASSSAAGRSLDQRLPLLSELIVLDVAVGRTKVAAKKRSNKWRQAAQQTKLNIVDKHRLLKHHCSLIPSPADPPRAPTFHVGHKARGKKAGVAVQLRGEKPSKKEKKKAGQKGSAKRPQTRSQGADRAALPSSSGAEAHDNSSNLKLTDLDAFLPPAKAMAKKQKKGAKASNQPQSCKQKRAAARAQLLGDRAKQQQSLQQQQQQSNQPDQSPQAKKQKLCGKTATSSGSPAQTVQQPAAGGSASGAEGMSKKERRKARKASAKETDRREGQRRSDKGRGVQAGGVQKKKGGKFARKNAAKSANAAS